MNVKIIGAGSAGNHIAFALQRLVKKITLTDISKDALNRSKNKIYIPRYGIWSKKIYQQIEGRDEDAFLLFLFFILYISSCLFK